MLYIILFVCAAAIIAIPFLLKKDRKLLIRCIFGLVITTVFFGASVLSITQMTKGFLTANYDELVVIAQGGEVEDGKVKYTKKIVFDPFSLEIDQEEEEPTKPSEATKPNEPTKPNKPDEGLEGFSSRTEEMVSEMQEGSTRGNILSSALKNWKNHPWFGVGFGANLPGLEANNGTYEMEYVVRLYTTGVVGIVILLGLMLYVGITPLQHIKKLQQGALFLVPITLAYLGAAMATISNPYIFSGFDYLFMIFLPVAYLNCCKTEASNNSDLK